VGREQAHLGEFDLIRRYFSRIGGARSDVVLGVGDDAALLRMPAEGQAGFVQLGAVHGHGGLVGEDAQYRQVCRLWVALDPGQPD